MPDSKKLQVMKLLTAHLQGMNPDANDPATGEAYEIDMRGDQVQRGRLVFGPDDTVDNPLLSILEAPKPIDPRAVGEAKLVRKSMWPLLVQGFVKDTKTNPTDPAYDLLAKTEQRLARIVQLDDQGDPMFPGEYLLDSSIFSLAIGEGIVRPSDPQVSPTAFFYLPLAVELVTDLRNPYAD